MPELYCPIHAVSTSPPFPNNGECPTYIICPTHSGKPSASQLFSAPYSIVTSLKSVLYPYTMQSYICAALCNVFRFGSSSALPSFPNSPWQPVLYVWLTAHLYVARRSKMQNSTATATPRPNMFRLFVPYVLTVNM